MKLFPSILAVAALLPGDAFARLAQFEDKPSRPLHMRMHPPVIDDTAATSGHGFFQQYIDHKNKSMGTFSQQYWWSNTHCSGSGCPVVLFTPGEENATQYQGYLTDSTITGQFAKAIGGAVVLLEHRYWGDSSPYTKLTTDNMRFLTLDNSVHDLTNFAKTVKLPFDTNGSSNAKKAPWVLSGGSYSGALSAWTQAIDPGTFWAYHASSAPVEAISDFWQYFYPVQDGMPKNCSKDISLVIDHIDTVFKNGSKTETSSLKNMFGLGDLENDDFGAAIENGPWLWQGNNFYANEGFFDFCDAVENAGKFAPNGTSNTTLPDANGVGLQKALNGYASWFKASFLPGWCAAYGYQEWQDKSSTACFNTHNVTSPMYTDTSLSNSFDRQWQWFLCNEPFGYWQDGAPTKRSSLISRLVTADYWQSQCQLFFPKVNGYTFDPTGHSEHDVNGRTGGWKFTNTTRLIWANGQYDPWRSAGTSSNFRPGGPLASTPKAPVNLIPSGYHCSDLLMKNGDVNAGVREIQNKEIAQIAAWVKEWPGTNATYI